MKEHAPRCTDAITARNVQRIRRLGRPGHDGPGSEIQPNVTVMTSFKQLRSWTMLGLLGAATLQCGGDGNGPPTATTIAQVSGDGQDGLVGQTLASPLVVKVTDASGDPVDGISVQWTAQGGGSISSTAVETGTDGLASVQRILGPDPGDVTTTASVSGLQGSPVTFTSTAIAGTGPRVALTTQPSATAQSGVALTVQPMVQLQDADGNNQSQSGVVVTVSIASGTGTLGGAVMATTGSNGAATFTDLRITGAAGAFTLRFSAPGTTPAVSNTITLSGNTGGGIALVTNPPVSPLNGEVFDPTVQPVVQVTDGSGGVSGVQVTAALATGSGTLDGTTTATTDASGMARFADLGISGVGSHSIVFTATAGSVTSSTIDVQPLSSKASTGEWGPVIPWGIVPLHMSLLPNGKILAWGKYEDGGAMGTMATKPRLWDPAVGNPTTASQVPADTMLFCSGHTLMPDGRLMVSGGHKADDTGIDVTNIFDPQTQSWLGGLPKMAHGRWYPTVTTLPDGRMLTMAGRDEAGQVVTTPELWVGDHWVELPGAGSFNVPYYPRNFVPPSGPLGRIFMAGERVRSQWFDVDGSTASGSGRWTTNGPTHLWPFNRDYGTAVMYEPGKILYAGGGGNSTWGQTPDARASAPTATAEIIDLNAASPAWTSAGAMAFPRRHLNSTMLPDGTVLITGGTTGGGFVDINEGHAAKAAELWDPKAPTTWTTLASASKMRVYHSVSLLLPDATVLSGASGDAFAGPVEVPAEKNHEIFSPPYLFKGARPTITSVSTSSVSYGGTFTVTTPNAAQITTVRWIHLGSVTHAFDAGQRADALPFTATATGVDVTVPASNQRNPPGHYLVFILNRNGVPSVGKIVQVH
jgi:hypothetical protein